MKVVLGSGWPEKGDAVIVPRAVLEVALRCDDGNTLSEDGMNAAEARQQLRELLERAP